MPLLSLYIWGILLALSINVDRAPFLISFNLHPNYQRTTWVSIQVRIIGHEYYLCSIQVAARIPAFYVPL
jgi:hypothetical protein